LARVTPAVLVAVVLCWSADPCGPVARAVPATMRELVVTGGAEWKANPGSRGTDQDGPTSHTDLSFYVIKSDILNDAVGKESIK
jgi:hypothetical protein